MTFDFHAARDRARRRAGLFRLVFAAMLALVVAGYVAVLRLAAGSVAWSAAVGMGGVDATPFVVGAVGVGVAVVSVRALLAERAALLSGAKVARMLRAREVRAEASAAERTLRNVTEEVAVAAGMPAPRLYVMPRQPGINALAVGPDVAHGALFVSSSAVEELSRDALQAVVAHEIAHLASGDAALHALSGGASAALRTSVAPLLAIGRMPMSLAPDPAGPDGTQGSVDPRVWLLAALLSPFPVWILWITMDGFGGALGALAVLAVGLPLVGVLGALFAGLVDLAVSQQTEYAADALAVELTRHPEGLAEALTAVRDGALKGALISPAVPRLRPFFFARPVIKPPFMDGLFESHPPPGKRLAQLRTATAGRRWRAAARPRSLDATPAPRGLADARRALDDAAPTDALAAAGALLGALPEAVRTAAHDVAGVEPLVYALLLDAAPQLRLRQRGALPPTLADRALALHAEVSRVPRSARLPVAEIAVPALRRLGAPARRRVLATAEALAHADGRLSVAEVTLTEALRRTLSPPRNGRPVTPERIAEAGAHVVAALAQSGSRSPSARAAALDAGIDTLAGHLYGAAAPARAPSADAFRAALDTLAAADGPSQRAVLDAALVTVWADGRATRDETDLVRLLAFAMGRPSPLPLPRLTATETSRRTARAPAVA